MTLFFLSIISFFLGNTGDDTLKIRFIPWSADHELHLGEAFEHPVHGPITIDNFRFYIGPIIGYESGRSVSVTRDHQLLDAGDPTSLNFDLPQHFDSLTFTLGVDSITNVSGAFGGDLDPTNGMYWAWNSGYINLKLEGRGAISPYPKQQFELHLGGYLPPHQTLQQIVLRPGSTSDVIVHLDVMELLKEVDLSTRSNVMSPGEEAVRLSKAAARMFKAL
jgi:hypothetical protein